MQPAPHRSGLSALLALSLLAATGPVSAETALLMGEETGCLWCARWDSEIAPAYPRTDEGRAAPLRRLDIRAPVPEDVTLAAPLRFTPTFVLLDDGREVSRIEGYPGEDFFWPLLGRMLDSAAKDGVADLEGWRREDR